MGKNYCTYDDWHILFATLSPAYAATDLVIATRTLEYDANGNLEKVTTANTEDVLYEYDDLNRLTKRTNPDGSVAELTYDAKGNRLTMSDSHGTTYYAYDIFSRLRAVQHPGINPIYYEYDNLGQITKLTDPLSLETSYEYLYDGNGNRTQVIETVTGEATTTIGYLYDKLNRLMDVTREKGSDLYSVDWMSLVISLRMYWPATGGEGVIYE